MEWTEIALICVSAVLVIVAAAWIITAVVNKRKTAGNRVDDVYIKDGVRYTRNGEVVDEKGNVKISLNKGDIMLERGKEYICSKEGQLLPGKYTVLSADENNDKVNIRLGGVVREYNHFSSIVITEGDEISSVSHNIILR
ncbi:MAG: hypothetical protein IJZ26_03545 [Clostridia bacterium]|nr:hypothetical protein [Clostridia bacterium]